MYQNEPDSNAVTNCKVIITRTIANPLPINPTKSFHCGSLSKPEVFFAFLISSKSDSSDLSRIASCSSHVLPLNSGSSSSVSYFLLASSSSLSRSASSSSGVSLTSSRLLTLTGAFTVPSFFLFMFLITIM